MLLDKITANNYQNLEEMPIAEWVNEISEGKSQYLIKQKKRAALKKDFFEKRK